MFTLVIIILVLTAASSLLIAIYVLHELGWFPYDRMRHQPTVRRHLCQTGNLPTIEEQRLNDSDNRLLRASHWADGRFRCHGTQADSAEGELSPTARPGGSVAAWFGANDTPNADALRVEGNVTSTSSLDRGYRYYRIEEKTGMGV